MFATVQKESSRGCWKAVAGDSSFFIPVRVFLSEKLYEGQELSEGQFEALRCRCALEECYQKALGLLGSREHLRFELKTKLAQRGFEAAVIGQVLDVLEEEGSLDEQRFCVQYALSRGRKKPEGRLVMQLRLLQKGARREMIERALDEVYTGEYSLELAQRAYEGLMRRHEDEQVVRDCFLKAGFDSYQLQAVKEILSEK